MAHNHWESGERRPKMVARWPDQLSVIVVLA